MAVVSLKPSSKGVTAMIVVAVVLFFCCVLAYLAAAGKLKSAASELEASEKQVADAKQLIKKLEKSRLDYADAKAQLRCLESSVSTQAYVPTMLKQVELLGKSVNLKVSAVRPAPMPAAVPTRKLSSGTDAANGNVEAASEQKTANDQAAVPPSPYDEMNVDLEIDGRYMDVLDFLYKITSFKKIIAVNSVDMSPFVGSTKNSGSPMLAVKMNITAFVFKEAAKTETDKPEPVTTSKNPSGSKGGDSNEAG